MLLEKKFFSITLSTSGFLLVRNNTESYKKFISYLLKNNLQLKAFNLCAHEAGAVEEEKTKFTELLAEEKNSNPNAATYTIKLNDSSIALFESSVSLNNLTFQFWINNCV